MNVVSNIVVHEWAPWPRTVPATKKARKYTLSIVRSKLGHEDCEVFQEGMLQVYIQYLNSSGLDTAVQCIFPPSRTILELFQKS